MTDREKAAAWRLKTIAMGCAGLDRVTDDLHDVWFQKLDEWDRVDGVLAPAGCTEPRRAIGVFLTEVKTGKDVAEAKAALDRDATEPLYKIVPKCPY